MTSLLEALCAPYVEGDQVEVQDGDEWVTARVLTITRTSGPFGLVWSGAVQFTSGRCASLVVNDDGRNNTNGRGVRPAAPDMACETYEQHWDDSSGEDVLVVTTTGDPE